MMQLQNELMRQMSSMMQMGNTGQMSGMSGQMEPPKITSKSRRDSNGKPPGYRYNECFYSEHNLRCVNNFTEYPYRNYKGGGSSGSTHGSITNEDSCAY